MRRYRSSISESIERHSGFVLTSIKEHFAYRFDFFSGLIFSLMMMSLLYYLWSAIYQNATNFTMPFQQTITYICLGQAFNFTRQQRNFERLNHAIRSGDIGITLVRPSDFQSRLLAESVGAFLVETLVLSLPAYLLALLVFNINAPASWLAAVGFTLSLFGAFLISFTLDFLVSVLAFWTMSTFGLVYAKKAIVDILAGTIIPFAFFPSWLRQIAVVLPFQGIAAIPLSIYVGTIEGSAIWTNILLQFGWAIALLFATRLLWSHATRRLVIQGG